MLLIYKHFFSTQKKFDLKLLNYIYCPISKDKLEYKDNVLISKKLGITYPIVDGIPIITR